MLIALGTGPHVKAQSPYFSEAFEFWNAQSPLGWFAMPATGCQTGVGCYWSREDDLDPTGAPASLGCEGHYARLGSSQLTTGQRPVLVSPLIDLSQVNSLLPLELHFCYINPGNINEGDGIRVAFSRDGGTTWHDQLGELGIYPQWTSMLVPIADSFRTTTFRLRIEGQGNLSSTDVGIDEILIVDPPTCTASPSSVGSTGALSVCRDTDPDWIGFSHSGDTLAEYSYLITDVADHVLEVVPNDLFDFNELVPAAYRVYGVSHTGPLFVNPGLHLSTVEGGVCHVISANYIGVSVHEVAATASVVSDYNGVPVSVAGAADGIATASIQAGTAPYAYTWSTQPPQATATATGLAAGTYAVVVQDSRGCRATATVSLTEPDPLVVQLTAGAIDCHGAQTGSLAAQVQGGVAPYTLAWSGTGQTGDSLTGLGAGQYSVVVSDVNGALATGSVALAQPAPLAVGVQTEDPTCPETADGRIALAPQGGTGPYSFRWQDGYTTPVRAGLLPGRYAVVIRDSLGCEVAQDIVLVTPQPIVNDLDIQQPGCANPPDGWVQAFTEGGTAPYDYVWTHGPREPLLAGVGEGTYVLYTYDARGCVRTDTARLVPAEVPRLAVSTQPDEGLGNGSAVVEVQGGAGPYDFWWNDGGSDSLRSDLAAGDYEVQVTDQRGCTATLPVAIAPAGTFACLEIHMGFSPNGDGVNEYWVIPCLHLFPDNELHILNRWGQEIYHTTNYQNDWNGMANGQHLPDGTYYYLLKLNGPTDRRLFKGTVSIIR
ncbi:MAG: hypothetical protein OHK0039_38740 [Bacteroidia bacterium]